MYKNCTIGICVATSALALSFLMIGCDRQVSNTESRSASSDGTVKSKKETVTQAPDGTVTKTEESKTTYLQALRMFQASRKATSARVAWLESWLK